jgi:hypothetical protein
MHLHPKIWLLLLALPACSDSGGGGGGGGGADGEAALAALGFTPGDVADMATSTMVVSLDWLTNDGIVPTARLGDCPSVVQGSDDNANGHPDSLEIAFDCTNLEGFTIAGSVFLDEYEDPSSFAKDAFSCMEAVAQAGVAEWGMSGSFFLNVQELGSPVYQLTGSLDFAEFPAIGQLMIELHTSAPFYPVDGGVFYDVGTNMCATLPTDDSTDFPAGIVETFVFDGPPPALLSLECELLTNGTVDFAAFNGPTLIASGIINLVAEDGSEIQFD